MLKHCCIPLLVEIFNITFQKIGICCGTPQLPTYFYKDKNSIPKGYFRFSPLDYANKDKGAFSFMYHYPYGYQFDHFPQHYYGHPTSFPIMEQQEPSWENRQPNLERRVNALERQNERQSKELTRLNDEIKRQNEEIRRLNRELIRVNEQVVRVNDRVEQHTQRLNRLNQRLRALETRFSLPFTPDESGF